MPIVRADVPDWATREQMAELRAGLYGCIERTWAREHIWVAVRGMYAEPKDATVILTVDLRNGRGQEAERTEALFEEALDVCNRILGTTGERMIVLVRKFGQDECISGGDELPPLSQLTPALRRVSKK
ncbi:MAG TPA: hypothetical protein VHN11_03895 [Xanthobacteraceae bacterium]|jgi:hypothetical protein|nr:hypothetical protein [Xanthobacteraceae bacterium]